MNNLLALAQALLIWLTLFTSALGSPRDDIEDVYRLTYKAANLKYRAGMYAHRGSEYKAYDLDGREVDPRKERDWLFGLLDRAVTFNETGVITDFTLLSEVEAECVVVDTIEAKVFADTTKANLSKVVLTTRSTDLWRLTDFGWKQTSSRILEQTYGVVPSGK